MHHRDGHRSHNRHHTTQYGHTGPIATKTYTVRTRPTSSSAVNWTKQHPPWSRLLLVMQTANPCFPPAKTLIYPQQTKVHNRKSKDTKAPCLHNQPPPVALTPPPTLNTQPEIASVSHSDRQLTNLLNHKSSLQRLQKQFRARKRNLCEGDKDKKQSSPLRH